MRLVVLDTNVIVSAAIRPGSAPARLIMDWVLDGRVEVVTSPYVISEYREVVRRPKFSRFGFPPYWLEFLIAESFLLPDPRPWPKQGPDPQDIPFLALANQAGAWFVTGNLKHFPKPIRGGAVVLPPAEYVSSLEAK